MRGIAALYSVSSIPPIMGGVRLAIQRSLARPTPLHPALLGLGHLTSWRARLGKIPPTRYKMPGLCVYMYVCLYAGMNVYVHAFMYVCVHECVHVCVNMYVCM